MVASAIPLCALGQMAEVPSKGSFIQKLEHVPTLHQALV